VRRLFSKTFERAFLSIGVRITIIRNIVYLLRIFKMLHGIMNTSVYMELLIEKTVLVCSTGVRMKHDSLGLVAEVLAIPQSATPILQSPSKGSQMTDPFTGHRSNNLCHLYCPCKKHYTWKLYLTSVSLCQIPRTNSKIQAYHCTNCGP
jgi:hypothetical protein